jgi:hypothetical protein
MRAMRSFTFTGCTVTRHLNVWLGALLLSLCILPIAHAEFPWKATGADASDPYNYANYMYILPSQFPPADLGGDIWKYSSKNACQLYGTEDSRCSDLINANPQELYGVTGASIDLAWETTTGRPDVVIAVTDSGIKWNDGGKMNDLRYKTWLNRGELPLPRNAAGVTTGNYDINQDGVFNLRDYENDSRVRDLNGTGFVDPEDLIFVFSDGVDTDANGYKDDFCGWDFFEDDNDPFDENQYGHGSGEAEDSTAEANNGNGVGVAPNCMVMHMRVGDSFIADITDFAEAVAYATDNGASVVQCALGTLNNSRFTQEVINYAYERGTVLIASAADESAGHHNMPAMLEHAVTVNSVGEPEFPAGAELQPSYLEFRGCTNYGAYITATVPSNSCSSEATGRCSGMAGLIHSAARNALSRGTITDYGVLDGSGGVPAGRAISAEEVDQIISTTADDINFVTPVLYTLRPFPETERYPATQGWDPFFGYGRVNAARMVRAISENKIPPEADITDPEWFEIYDPAKGPIHVNGRVASLRSAKYSYAVKWAVWSWRDLNSAPNYTSDGVSLAVEGIQSVPYSGLLATISEQAIASAMLTANGPLGATSGPAVDPITGRGDHENRQLPDKFSVIVQLVVTSKNAEGQNLTNIDGAPLTGIGTKSFEFHGDPALFDGFPMDLNGGMAACPRFADLDNDGVDELIVATSNGDVHAFKSNGDEVAGWPVHTSDINAHYGAPAFQSGEITTPIYAAALQSAAVGDIDRDGSLEVVVADYNGRVSAFNRHGQMLPGFPVRSNPAYSQAQRADREQGFYASNPAFLPGDYPGSGSLPNTPDHVPDLINRKNKMNSSTWSFLASPTLGNIDFTDDDLEILAGAMDRHLYAFRSNGQPVPGWPVMLRDPATLASANPLTHRVSNLPGFGDERGAMMIASPAVGDINGDGTLDIVAVVNEQYEGTINSDDFVMPTLLSALDQEGGNNRVYALHADGALHGGVSNPPGAHPNPNAYMPGWPAQIGTLAVDLLPVVGEGPNCPPVLADVNGDGDLEIGVFGTVGPAYILGPDGISLYGRNDEGLDKTLLMEPFGVGSNSLDTPSIPAVGGGIFTHFSSLGSPVYAAGTAGLGKFLDLFLPDDQILSDNHLTVWDLSGSRLQLPFFPREVNDLHFLCTPASADVDGDGLEEILDATAYYDLHAFGPTGEEPGLHILSPTGWPKFTAGWHFSSPSVGDFDGDGLRDIALTTREAKLFVWHGNGATTCDPASWPEWGHDGWNTNNLHTDTVRPERIDDLSIYSAARATGGGHIPKGLAKANFGFDAFSDSGELSGHLLFDDKSFNGPHVTSESITSFIVDDHMTLKWTAPSDGACGGTVSNYEIRYSSAAITESNYDSATVLSNSMTPQSPGSQESLPVSGLAAGTYHFVVQSVDAAGNIGPISDNVTITLHDAAPGHATIEGTATVNGSPGHAFTIEIADNGEPGKNVDTFEISLDTGYSAGGYLSGGNIQVFYEQDEVEQEPELLIVTLWQLLFGLTGLNFLLGLL